MSSCKTQTSESEVTCCSSVLTLPTFRNKWFIWPTLVLSYNQFRNPYGKTLDSKTTSCFKFCRWTSTKHWREQGFNFWLTYILFNLLFSYYTSYNLQKCYLKHQSQILKNCIHLSSLCRPVFSLLSDGWCILFSLFIQFFLFLFILFEIISCYLSWLIGLFLFYYLTFRSFPISCNFFLFIRVLKTFWYSQVDLLLYFLSMFLTR